MRCNITGKFPSNLTDFSQQGEGKLADHIARNVVVMRGVCGGGDVSILGHEPHQDYWFAWLRRLRCQGPTLDY